MIIASKHPSNNIKLIRVIKEMNLSLIYKSYINF